MKIYLDRIRDTNTKVGLRRCFHCGRGCDGRRCDGDAARTCFLEIEGTITMTSMSRCDD